MAIDIAPGSKINVKIVTTPTSQAAAKTLVRILSKDKTVKVENERLRKSRASGLTHQQRGGRQWYVYVPKIHPVKGEAGEHGTIQATVDVIADLRSVEKFIEVSKA